MEQLQQVQQQHQQRNQQYWQLQQQLLTLANSLQFYFTDPATVKATTTYQRCAQIISLLSPWMFRERSTHGSERISTAYVMVEDFEADSTDAAYSFGIADDVSWDEEIADRGITRQFPTELDQPTYQDGHDVYLGRFDPDAPMNGLHR